MFRNVYIVLIATITISVLVESRTVFRGHNLGIINGQVATPHESPSTVRLWTFIRTATGRLILHMRCGASLISENYLLSAKHCIEGAAGTNAYLGDHETGKQDPGEERQRIYNQNFIPHPSVDLVLIKLNTSVTYSNTIKSVTLPLKKDANETYVGQTATAFGWGRVSDNGTLARYLMKVDLTVISNSECQTELQKHNTNMAESYEVCTSGSNAGTPLGACHGDSGGPLFINNVLVGVTVRGVGMCEVGGPTVYIRTGHFLDWIEQETGIPLP